MFQYVSCSWDQSIRVWNAWKKQVKRREPDEDGDNPDGSQMKKVEISLEEEEEELGEGQINQGDMEQDEGDGDDVTNSELASPEHSAL